MIYRLLLAALCVVLFSVNADARQRHRVGHIVSYDADPSCNKDSGPNGMRCEGVAPSARGDLVVKAMHGLGSSKLKYTPRASTISVTSTKWSGFASGIGRPGRYIAGRLICAVNVNAALAERGIRGTGSAWAKSFLTWGHSAGGPIPGAVIVSSRLGGGHVAIVSRVENGVVYAWNATGGQSGWREIPYRHHVIDYRVPG